MQKNNTTAKENTQNAEIIVLEPIIQERTRKTTPIPSEVYYDRHRLVNMPEAAVLLGRWRIGVNEFLEEYGVTIIPKGSHKQVLKGELDDAIRKHYEKYKLEQEPCKTKPQPKKSVPDAFLEG